MFRRLLPLVVALLALLPAPVLAGCLRPRADDPCCCRRELPVEGETMRRIDCCEQPCTTPHAGAPAIVGCAAPRLLAPASAWPTRDRLASTAGADAAVPRVRPRGPPVRVHAHVQRWQL